MPVVLKDNSWGNADFDKFDNLPVQPMTSAKTVPLRQIAQVSQKWSESKIVHRNGVRCLTITAELPHTMMAEEIVPDLQKYVSENIRLPQGVTTEIGGEIENDNESLPQAILAKKSIEQAAENLRLNENYYKAGISTMSDLLEAQTLFQQSKDRYSEAYSTYEIKKTEYLISTGR